MPQTVCFKSASSNVFEFLIGCVYKDVGLNMMHVSIIIILNEEQIVHHHTDGDDRDHLGGL